MIFCWIPNADDMPRMTAAFDMRNSKYFFTVDPTAQLNCLRDGGREDARHVGPPGSFGGVHTSRARTRGGAHGPDSLQIVEG